MELISYVARRLALIIPTLLGASLVMFVLTMLIPGDPALMRLGNFATAEQLQSLRQEMGLTKPPYERYVLYLGGLLRGDMGRSWRTGNLVLDDLQARLPMSLELGLCSMLAGHRRWYSYRCLGCRQYRISGRVWRQSLWDYRGGHAAFLGWAGVSISILFQVRDRSGPHWSD